MYGSLDGVKAILKTGENQSFPAYIDTRLTNILNAVSSLIESETGKAWGGSAPSPSSALISTPGNSSLLVLPKPAFSISSVYHSPEWDGSDWSGGNLVPSDQYFPVYGSEDSGYLGLRGAGWWYGFYLVNGVFEPNLSTVPDDIHYVANYLTSLQYKIEGAGAGGLTGPNNETVPVRNLLKDPLVRSVLSKYRAEEQGVSF